MKKLSLLLASCFLLLASSGMVYASTTKTGDARFNSSLFNAESADFSRMETIKTWVADKYHNQTSIMKKVQGDVAMTVPQNPFSSHFAEPIVNNKGDTRYFGKTFHTLSAIELPFLQYVKQISQTRSPVTLEIAASMGLVSWKVPFCFQNGGIHYANELSKIVLDQRFEPVVNSRLGHANLTKHLTSLQGDCFTVLDHLKGKVDALYVQNLQHFFNPITNDKFMHLVNDLLAPGGRAYLSAHSFLFQDTEDALYKLYCKQKKGSDKYPGFVQYDVQFTNILGTEQGLEHTITNPIRPADDALITKVDKLDSDKCGVFNAFVNNQVVQVKTRKQNVVSNHFSPTIYQRTIADFPTLIHKDSFFITQEGERKKGWDWKGKISHAAAIVEKVAVPAPVAVTTTTTTATTVNTH